MPTYTSGGASQRPGADNSTEAKRKRAKRRADKRARDRARERRNDDDRGRRFLGSGQAGRAADKLKAKEQQYSDYYDKL